MMSVYKAEYLQFFLRIDIDRKLAFISFSLFQNFPPRPHPLNVAIVDASLSFLPQKFN